MISSSMACCWLSFCQRNYLPMETRQNLTATTFLNTAGQQIAYKHWSGNDSYKGILIIVHGLHSHSGYYHNFAWQVIEHYYEVYALDLRGRGQSEGLRYRIDDFEAIIGDIDALVTITSGGRPGLPIVLMGHNAGGVFAALYSIRHPARLKGVILQGISLRRRWPFLTSILVKVVSRISPSKRLLKIRAKHLSRDPSFADTVANDPLLANEKQPANTLQQLLQASALLQKQIHGFEHPVLLLHGTADRIAAHLESRHFFDSISSEDKQFKLYEGHYHDLLHDRCSGHPVLAERTGVRNLAVPIILQYQ